MDEKKKTNMAIAKLQAAADIALVTGCELAKIPAVDALEIADLLKSILLMMEQFENIEVRWQVAAAKLTYREIAKKIGVTHVWLSRCMSKPLKPEMRKKIEKAIYALIPMTDKPFTED